MPCRDDWSWSPQSGPNTTSIQLKNRLDLVTRVACDLETGACLLYENFTKTTVLDPLDNLSREGYISDETVKWVRAHRKADEERKASLKESALAKLTTEEKEALGL